jgi:hypothetical protein
VLLWVFCSFHPDITVALLAVALSISISIPGLCC